MSQAVANHTLSKERMVNTMKTSETFSIKYHAQIQTINGTTYEFQPEHLFCDNCWNLADNALGHASYFGSCKGVDLDENYKEAHAITVTKVEETK